MNIRFWAKIEFWVSVIALFIALASAWIAYNANNLTLKLTEKAERPWLRVNDEKIIDLNLDQSRIIGKIENVAGGPALNLSFKAGINDNISNLIVSSGVLLPGEKLDLSSSVLVGGKIKENDVIVWITEYEDTYGNKYRVTERKLIAPNFLKELEYIPEKL